MGFAAILVATSVAWLGTPHNKMLAAQLDNVPSHNRAYRASLVPSRDEWTLRVENSDHEPVSGASLVMQAWMPEDSSIEQFQARVIANGDGSYRVEGLRLDRPGWWNMKLEVAHAGVTDSLAFNVVMR